MYLDGVWLKRSWVGEVRNVSVLVAIGGDEKGFRHVLSVSEDTKEDGASWTAFLLELKHAGWWAFNCSSATSAWGRS